jgi:hypothetical protein
VGGWIFFGGWGSGIVGAGRDSPAVLFGGGIGVCRDGACAVNRRDSPPFPPVKGCPRSLGTGPDRPVCLKIASSCAFFPASTRPRRIYPCFLLLCVPVSAGNPPLFVSFPVTRADLLCGRLLTALRRLFVSPLLAVNGAVSRRGTRGRERF